MVLGAGVYLAQRSTEFFASALERQLEPYGVEGISFSRPAFSLGSARLGELRLAGQQAGATYQLELQDISLTFTWEGLQAGKFDGLSVGSGSVDATLTDTEPSASSTATHLGDFLPQRNLFLVPLEHLLIEDFQLTIRSSKLPGGNLSAHASLALRESRLELALQPSPGQQLPNVDITSSPELPLALAAKFPDPQQQPLALKAELQQAAGTRWRWQLTGGLDFAGIQRWLKSQSFFAPDFTALGSLQEPLLTAQGQTRFALDLQHPAQLPKAPAELPGLLAVSGEFWHQVQLPSAGEDLRALSAKVHHQFNWQEEQLSRSLSSEALLAAEVNPGLLAITENDAAWPRLKLVLDTDTRFTGSLDGKGTLQSHAADISLEGPNGGEIFLNDLTLSSADTIDFSGAVRARLRWQDKRLPELLADITADGDGERWQGKLKGAAPEASLTVLAEAGWNSQTENIQLESRLVVDDLVAALAAAEPFAKTGDILALTSGQAALKVAAAGAGINPTGWNKQLELEAQNLEGIIDEVVFSSLSLAAAVSGQKQWRSSKPFLLNAAEIRSGVVASNVVLQGALLPSADISQAKVRIDDFRSELLGGKLLSPAPFTLDMAAVANPFKLQFTGWRLEDLLALQQQEGLKASGILDGELPLSYGTEGGRLTKGTLRARLPGGIIAYDSGAEGLAAASPELGLAMRMLTNFHFHELSCSADFSPEGKLELALSLGGSNPNELDGRATQFNINLEENVYPLLESLRLTDDFTRNMEKRLAR